MVLTVEAPTEAPVKTTRDILLHAARIIEEQGWIQETWENSQGVCALGALAKAATGSARPLYVSFDSMLFRSYIRAADAFERSRADISEMGVPSWNDAPERNASEVVSALRMAAEAFA